MSDSEQSPDAPQGPCPDLSVLIPTYGRGPTLDRLLQSLGEQTLSPDRFEVIVVDDGSPEPVVLQPADFAFSLHLERQENAGPGAARNRGLEHCTAPLVLILNDDAVPADDLLATHLTAHDEAPAKCAVLGTFRFTEEARRHPFVRILDESDLLFTFSSLRHGQLHSWQFFWTCNLSLPVQALRDIGGFDSERFTEAIVEDVELGYRLEQEGWHVLYREDAVCHHDHVISPAAHLERAVRLGVFLTRMWEKHEDPTILYSKTDEDVREQQRGCADVVEHYQSVLERLVRGLERLERLEDEYLDRELPAELQQKAVDLVRELSRACRLRGLHLESTGVDLAQLAKVGPPRDLLTSVVVVSHEALGKTRRCIERLLATREEGFPIELIVVDNGSTDGSAQWLAEQPEVRLVRNESNLGAPHARNQAIALAQGEWIAFFDNDVYVTDGWLSKALYHGAIDPAVGAVCLVSNRASKHQQVPYEGDSSEDNIERQAAIRAREWSRRGRDMDLFTSLGVLVRRKAVDDIGGFDECFSPWGFEDDDYSLRLRLAGFRCRVAQDVFVYHDHYHDGEKERRHSDLLQRNWKHFATKWGSGEIPRIYDYEALDLDLSSTRPLEELYLPLVQSEEPLVYSEEPLVDSEDALVDSDPNAKSEALTTSMALVETRSAPLPEPAAEDGRRSVLILGSGRSGTSMLAGTLASAGWDVGDEPYAAREANPKGFFETAEINGINEYLLAAALPAHPPMERMQRWLAEAPLELELQLPAGLGQRIERMSRRRPFAFKDPRFCYTLPAWRPLLGEFGVLCVFREPAVTAASICKECDSESYLASLEMDFERAVRTWVAMYRQVVERHRHQGDWLFVHYDQLFDHEGLTRLEDFVGGSVGREFPDQSLRRSQSQEPVSPEAAALYDELCGLAGYDTDSVSVVEPPEVAPAEAAEPELTVLICTYQRRETLVRCLDSFCAQTAPHGSFELVIVNDGSTDGTAEYLDQRDFSVPVQVVHRENGGLSAARNSGLEVTRGRIVLLVNDDTIATPGLVGAHLAAHRKLKARKVAVLGTFEQPDEALDNALMRTLEETDLVFCYASMQPGKLYNWNRFWTCNVSVPTEAVREVGCFDEEFRHYGCEDTDLALRLDEAGYEVYYEDGARAHHEHLLEFDDLARRNRTVARAWVRLFQKHPRALQDQAWSWVTAQGRDEYERLLVEALPDMPVMENAARELSRIDLGALERLGTEGQAWASDVRVRLEKLLRVLNRLWWFEGLAVGLREFGLQSFQPLLETLGPWTLGTEAPLRVLAWPRYDRDDDLRRLAETYADVLLRTEGVCLCLRHDPERDGSLEQAVARVEAGLGSFVREGRVLDVLLVDDTLGVDDLVRLGRAVTCVLDLTCDDDPERAGFIEALGAVVVNDASGLDRVLTGSSAASPKLAAAG